MAGRTACRTVTISGESMGRYILRRILISIPVLFGITLVTFVLINLAPGDPARKIAGGTASPERLQAVTESLGLDKSVMEVFINDGGTSVTRVNYPRQQDLGITAFSENGEVTLKSLDVWQMKPIW